MVSDSQQLNSIPSDTISNIQWFLVLQKNIVAFSFVPLPIQNQFMTCKKLIQILQSCNSAGLYSLLT